MQPMTLALDDLESHPANSNVMPAALFEKLVSHLRRSGRYPPIIVRALPGTTPQRYQILDGHHRVRALRELGHAQVQCTVWPVDDAEALLLLATLNRLQGQDDPHRRGELIVQLCAVPGVDLSWLSDRLPEPREQLERLAELTRQAPLPRPPQSLQNVPVALHFFLLPSLKHEVERKLKARGGTREQALLALLNIQPITNGA